MACSISGKFGIITGGAQGIGFEISKELLNNQIKGLIIADINEEKGQEALDVLRKSYGENRVHFIKTDVTDPDNLEECYKLALSQFGGLDLVINNAGVFSDKFWQQEIDINCVAVVRSTLLAFKYMGKNNGSNGGIVVNISSISALYPVALAPIYAATKNFTLGFTSSLATPFYEDKTGVTFRIICPGFTSTQMITNVQQRVLEDFPELCRNKNNNTGGQVAQSPKNVAQCIIKAIKEGSNGSIWNPENDEIYELELPDRFSLRKTM